MWAQSSSVQDPEEGTGTAPCTWGADSRSLKGTVSPPGLPGPRSGPLWGWLLTLYQGEVQVVLVEFATEDSESLAL